MAMIECKAAGTVAASEVGALAELLAGLSGFPAEPVRQHETVLKGPLRDRLAPELRLTQYLTSPAAHSLSPGVLEAREPRRVRSREPREEGPISRQQLDHTDVSLILFTPFSSDFQSVALTAMPRVSAA